MSHKSIDWPFLVAGLLIGSALMGYYIHETDAPDWKFVAVIGAFTLGIVRGRTWFNTIVNAIKAWRRGDNEPTG